MKTKIREICENCVVALLWVMCWFLSILPRCIRYGVLVPFITFIMGRVAGYRKAVILRQLHDSFPTKSDAEINEICRRYYIHLAEMVVGTLSLAGMTSRRRRKYSEFNLPDDFHDVIASNNVIVMTSHYGFWELGPDLYIETPNHYILGAYRPIKSTIIDKLYRLLRKRERVVAVASKNFMRYYITNRHGIDGKGIILGLVSDQNCPPTKGCCWHNFLNHDSLFFDGGEQLARKFGLPVYYLELERIKAGCYRHNYTQIYDGNEEVAPHEITERYVRCLERTIEANPEFWMWSHKRWKNRPTAESKFYNDYKTIE